MPEESTRCRWQRDNLTARMKSTAESCKGLSEFLAKTGYKPPKERPGIHNRKVGTQGGTSAVDRVELVTTGVVAQTSIQMVSNVPHASHSRKYVVLSLRTLTPLSRPLAPQEEHTTGIVVFFWHAPHCQ